MFITAFTHRERLLALVNRALVDRLHEFDGRDLTEIFVFEGWLGLTAVTAFLDDLCAISMLPVRHEPCLRKAHLRRSLRFCAPLRPQTIARIERFERNPDDYFCETPIDARLSFDSQGRLVSILRVKSLRRLADKSARFVAERLSTALRSTARSLAEERAWAAGLSIEQLVSAPETMAEEFGAAEHSIAQRFARDAFHLQAHDCRIDDFYAATFVVADDENESLRRAIERHPQVIAVHDGADATGPRLLIELARPTRVPLPPNPQLAAARGLDESSLAAAFERFQSHSANSIGLELRILSGDALIELELGPVLPEERLLDLRRNAPYAGPLAQNAAFILQYLLMVAASPSLHARPLPIKMWGRYLPESASQAIWDLFGVHIPARLVPLAEP